MADHLSVVLVSVAIEAIDSADHEKMIQLLRQLEMRVAIDRETGCAMIGGKNEQELETIVDRLSREFKIETRIGKPQVEFRETIRCAAECEHKFVRQSGNRGNYAHVRIRIEPLTGSDHCEFIDRTEGGVISPAYVQSVEAGFFEAVDHGIVAGYPAVGIRAILLDGSYHEADSSELAFKIAASMAFKKAAMKASPVVVEPLMVTEVVTPEELVAGAIGDLMIRNAVVKDVQPINGARVVTAEARLARMLGFAKTLHVITHGRATFTMELKDYVPVVPNPDPDDSQPASMAMRVA